MLLSLSLISLISVWNSVANEGNLISDRRNIHNVRPVILMPGFQNGSWAGDYWFPPEPWVAWSPNEMQEFYKTKSILWIGDSTSRRSALTFHALLNFANHTNASDILSTKYLEDANLINVGKMQDGIPPQPCNRTEFESMKYKSHLMCRDMPGTETNAQFLLLNLVCPSQVEDFFDSELENPEILPNVDVVIIGVGTWLFVRPWDCRLPNRTYYDVHEGILMKASQLFEQNIIKSGAKFIWRTAPYPDFPEKKALVDEVNQDVLQHINSNTPSLYPPDKVGVVDFANAILPRSFNDLRIKGDIKAHHGFLSRLVLIQMVTNKLYEMENLSEYYELKKESVK